MNLITRDRENRACGLVENALRTWDECREPALRPRLDAPSPRASAQHFRVAFVARGGNP